MQYCHQWQNQDLELPIGKAVCVGRNYALHAQELGNPTPSEPILFIKPGSCFKSFDTPIIAKHSAGNIHYEAEIALLINQKIASMSPDKTLEAVWGIGVALDLTLRDLQTQLKNHGLPWEKAKAFDNSCVLSNFIPIKQISAWNNISLKLELNDHLVQHGNSSMMLHPIAKLLSYISQFFTLYPGDVVLTGTPEGTGMLQPNQQLTASLSGLITATTEVI